MLFKILNAIIFTTKSQNWHKFFLKIEKTIKISQMNYYLDLLIAYHIKVNKTIFIYLCMNIVY